MTKSPEIVTAEILRCAKGRKPLRARDELAREEPLEIRVRGQSVAVTMRTPGHDDELAAGFLLTEGIIKKRRDVTEIAYCRQGGISPLKSSGVEPLKSGRHPLIRPSGTFSPSGGEGWDEGEAADYENTLNVFLSPRVEVDFERLTRHVFASSSCGLCGKASIESVHQHFAPVESRMKVSMENILRMPEQLRGAQATFAKTGGLHAAAIFDGKGKLLVLREDVGRHNAVDKVIGHGFLKNLLPFKTHALLVSGRASFEIMQKSLAARIPIVCAVSAPSSLAVEFARESGQTLVGFLREATMNIYANPRRIGRASNRRR